MPQLGDVAAVLQRYNALADLADGLDAPLDNLINTNLFPLPQVRAGSYVLQGGCEFLTRICSRPRSCYACWASPNAHCCRAHPDEQHRRRNTQHMQDDEQLRALLLRFTDDYCSPPSATSSETVRAGCSRPLVVCARTAACLLTETLSAAQNCTLRRHTHSRTHALCPHNLSQVLFEFQGPSLSIELLPLSCPVRSPVTSRSQIIFEECDPSQLVITTTPCERAATASSSFNRLLQPALPSTKVYM